MRYFLKIAEGIDGFPLLQRLARSECLWNADRVRQTFPGSPHAEVDDVLLRFEDVTDTEMADFVASDRVNTAPIRFRRAWRELPEVRGMIVGLMARVGAYALERVVITRLRPGATIAPHADDPRVYDRPEDIARYHIVLQASPGSLFHCGDETVQMAPGEAWWFNSAAPHRCENNGADDRVHMLVDVRLFP